MGDARDAQQGGENGAAGDELADRQGRLGAA